MEGTLERTYGRAIRSLMFAVNPIKKKLVKTHCTVHKYINMQAIDILRDEGCLEEYEFYRTHIKCLNAGVTWADQDFKSTNHFFHVHEEKGLYGFSNALAECRKYYDKAGCYLKAGDINKTLCYFGASCHLIQDATVPQHVNNKLLEKHRDFEQWIISQIMSDYAFHQTGGIIKYNTIDEFIKKNAAAAVKTHEKYKDVGIREERYKKIAADIIKRAQQSTAGLMIKFFREIIDNSSKN